MAQTISPKNHNFVTHRTTQPNYLRANILTPKNVQQCNIPIILKMSSLKQQHRETMYNIQKQGQLSNMQQLINTQRSAIKKMKQSINNISLLQQKHFNLLIPPYLHYNNNKFIDKVRYYQTNSENKKTFYTCVDKCKKDTNSYDQLKSQIINKIKIKKNQRFQQKNCNKSWANVQNKQQNLLISQQIQKQNLNKLCTDTKIKPKKHKSHIRYRSQSDSNKKAKRYTQISVAEFMQQKQSNISLALSKRFQQYRKQNFQSHKIDMSDQSFRQSGALMQNIQLTGRSQTKNYRRINEIQNHIFQTQ